MTLKNLKTGESMNVSLLEIRDSKLVAKCGGMALLLARGNRPSCLGYIFKGL